nr:uncharacterized protein LOC127312926 [Lolium perenne]
MECVCAAPRVAGVVGSRDVPAEAGVRAGAPGSLSCMQLKKMCKKNVFTGGLLSGANIARVRIFIFITCWPAAPLAVRDGPLLLAMSPSSIMVGGCASIHRRAPPPFSGDPSLPHLWSGLGRLGRALRPAAFLSCLAMS